MTLALGAFAFAQAPSANPIADPTATPDVMSFGELAGHILEVQYMVCSAVRGEANPNSGSLQPRLPP